MCAYYVSWNLKKNMIFLKRRKKSRSKKIVSLLKHVREVDDIDEINWLMQKVLHITKGKKT